MSDETPVPESDIIAAVSAILATLNRAHSVSLDSHHFDRLPCTRRRLYAIMRRAAGTLGYEYCKGEYVPSGNRPFQKNHKRGRRDGPSLYRVTAELP